LGQVLFIADHFTAEKKLTTEKQPTADWLIFIFSIIVSLIVDVKKNSNKVRLTAEHLTANFFMQPEV
jgi:hypothetical protein